MLDWVLVLITIVAVASWYSARSKNTYSQHNNSGLSRDYLTGLNHLLNEQPDKAVDVFIRMLEVDTDTVETHLALGNLFRRRGEVDRALRIHQNLVARTSLSKEQRIQALLALGQDYMKAGVYDRAEKLFMEIIEGGEHTAESLRHLLHIYQQEKEWARAITVAQKLEVTLGEPYNSVIAQFYCELAIEARGANHTEQALKYLKDAISCDKYCVRSNLLLGTLNAELSHYRSAIRAYKRAIDRNPDFLAEVIPHLVFCYQKLQLEEELQSYLKKLLEKYPRISLVQIISEHIKQTEGNHSAARFVTEQLKQNPSIRGLKQLIELQEEVATPEARENLQVLRDLTVKLLQDKPIYRCIHCGFSAKTIHWQCPGCKKWNSVKPIVGIEGG